MPQITRKYPGKTTEEIFQRVDAVMERIAQKLSLHYQKDGPRHTGKVSKMGVTGSYAVKEDHVVIDLEFPFLIPGSMRRQITEDIEKKLDGLFA
jgi:hypothetical protein